MKKANLKYIENFVDEVEALYQADEDATYIPEYIEDMVLNIRIIIKEELDNCDT